MHHLRKCEVITNFIGSDEVNAFVINEVLPGSRCNLIMFRSKKGVFNKEHDALLATQGFERKTNIKATLFGKFGDSFHVVIYQKCLDLDTVNNEPIQLPRYIDLSAARVEDVPNLVSAFLDNMQDNDPMFETLCASFIKVLRERRVLSRFIDLTEEHENSVGSLDLTKTTLKGDDLSLSSPHADKKKRRRMGPIKDDDENSVDDLDSKRATLTRDDLTEFDTIFKEGENDTYRKRKREILSFHQG